jgi:hypothetical protein
LNKRGSGVSGEKSDDAESEEEIILKEQEIDIEEEILNEKGEKEIRKIKKVVKTEVKIKK